MLVVGSTVWIDYFNDVDIPQVEFLNRALERIPILVGDMILTEVLQGFCHEADFETARRSLTRFTQAQMVNPALAVQSTHNYRLLRKKASQSARR